MNHRSEDCHSQKWHVFRDSQAPIDRFVNRPHRQRVIETEDAVRPLLQTQ